MLTIKCIFFSSIFYIKKIQKTNLNFFKKILRNPGTHNKPNTLWKERICPKKELSALGSGVTLTDLFNPTSGRDASHPCLISIVGGTNLPQEGIVHFGFRCDPHGFAQSHIEERRLPPLPYKH